MASHPNTVHRCHFSDKVVKGMCLTLLTLIITLKKLKLSNRNGAKLIAFGESYALKKMSRNIILKNYM